MTADGLGDAPTVQAGIDSASHGDVVLVGPGRYVENVDLRGKGIHLLGEMGPEATVLDGSGVEAPVVTCVSGETNATVIEGFTITGGRGRPFGRGRIGGGVCCDPGAPVIRGVVIRGNQVLSPDRDAQSRAGGLLAYAGHGDPLVLEDSVIEENYAWTNGGGVLAAGPCVIQRNVIRGNRTEWGDGGGLLVSRTPRSVYRENVIVGNEAGDHGGGVFVNNFFPQVSVRDIEIAGNVIVGNSAWGRDGAVDCTGGGVWVGGDGGAYLHHNTIAFNRAGSPGRFPAVGGICVFQVSPGTVLEYNIIYRNQDGGVGTYYISMDEWSLTVRRNVLFGNGLGEVYNRNEAVFVLKLEENVLADPMFCLTGSGSRGELAGVSPALNQPWGVIGAVAEPGCGPFFDGPPDSTVAVEQISWGAIKARYDP